jgi:hypothetical protein
MKISQPGIPGRRASTNPLAGPITRGSTPRGSRSRLLPAATTMVGTTRTSVAAMPARRAIQALASSPAPIACEASGSTAIVTPMAGHTIEKAREFPRDTADRSTSDTRPTIAASTRPIIIMASWAKAIGRASRRVARISVLSSMGVPGLARSLGLTVTAGGAEA